MMRVVDLLGRPTPAGTKKVVTPIALAWGAPVIECKTECVGRRAVSSGVPGKGMETTGNAAFRRLGASSVNRPCAGIYPGMRLD